MDTAVEPRVQNRYAHIAGFVYLLLIVLFMGGDAIISHVTGTGDFAQQLSNIARGATPYRFGLVLQMLASVFTVVLAYSLYIVVRPVNERMARLALYFRLGEAFTVVTMFVSFALLDLQSNPAYLKTFNLDQIKAMVDLGYHADHASFFIATLLFSIGSTLFFILFARTRYIPRLLSYFGVFASVATLLTSLADLTWPAQSHVLQFGWMPIFLSEILTGLWLLVRGVNVET